MGHLHVCKHCRGVFQDSVLFRGLWETGVKDFYPAEETVTLGRGVAAVRPARVAGQRARSAPVPLFIRRNQRYVALAACAAFIVISWLAIGYFNQRESSLTPAILAPVKRTVENATRIGPFIFPETEHALSQPGPVYRNGSVALDDSLGLSLRHLLKVYQEGRASSDETYWLLAGYVASNKIDMARDIATDIEQRYPEDVRILELRAIIEYFDYKYEKSVSIFRDTKRIEPDDPTTNINLAIALCRMGLREEAERLIDQILTHHTGTHLEKRIKSVSKLCKER